MLRAERNIAIWPRWKIRLTVACCVVISILSATSSPPFPLLFFPQELCGHCITLHCPVCTFVHNHHPLPLTMPALSGALCCQASWSKTATVGGREWWKLEGVEGEREGGRGIFGLPAFLSAYSQQKLMWIHLLNGCPMISGPRLVFCSPYSLLSQRITALCERSAADMPENLPCCGREMVTIRERSSLWKKAWSPLSVRFFWLLFSVTCISNT